MEGAALAEARADGLQAPKAHLPSLPAWRPEDRPPAATAVDPVLGGALPGRAESDAGQPRQADCWGGWSQEPPAAPAPRARGAPADPPDRSRGTPRLDSQARQARTTGPGHSHAPGSGRPDPGAARPGTGMGGAVRAEFVRLSPRTLHARCARDALHHALQKAEIRARRGHRGVF